MKKYDFNHIGVILVLTVGLISSCALRNALQDPEDTAQDSESTDVLNDSTDDGDATDSDATTPPNDTEDAESEIDDSESKDGGDILDASDTRPGDTSDSTGETESTTDSSNGDSQDSPDCNLLDAQGSCPSGEYCAIRNVDNEQKPFCVDLPDTEIARGDKCDTDGLCTPGTACVTWLGDGTPWGGENRCSAFCDVTADSPETCQDGEECFDKAPVEGIGVCAPTE